MILLGLCKNKTCFHFNYDNTNVQSMFLLNLPKLLYKTPG